MNPQLDIEFYKKKQNKTKKHKTKNPVKWIIRQFLTCKAVKTLLAGYPYKFIFIQGPFTFIIINFHIKYCVASHEKMTLRKWTWSFQTWQIGFLFFKFIDIIIKILFWGICELRHMLMCQVEAYFDLRYFKSVYCFHNFFPFYFFLLLVMRLSLLEVGLRPTQDLLSLSGLFCCSGERGSLLVCSFQAWDEEAVSCWQSWPSWRRSTPEEMKLRRRDSIECGVKTLRLLSKEFKRLLVGRIPLLTYGSIR